MTREHKLALVVGFGLILFVGILITDHLAADTRSHEPLPTARIPDDDPISLLGRDTTPLAAEPITAPILDAPARQPEIRLETPLDDHRRPARPMRATDGEATREIEDGALAGRGMATPPADLNRIHLVREGETLSRIAKKVYGDGGLWRRIANANPKVTPNALRPGTRLIIPREDPRSDRTVAAREVPARTTAERATRAYTVRKGDSLARIASRELGSERRWPEIKTLNALSGETIVPGQTITLPSR